MALQALLPRSRPHTLLQAKMCGGCGMAMLTAVSSILPFLPAIDGMPMALLGTLAHAARMSMPSVTLAAMHLWWMGIVMLLSAGGPGSNCRPWLVMVIQFSKLILWSYNGRLMALSFLAHWCLPTRHASASLHLCSFHEVCNRNVLQYFSKTI